MEMPPWRCSALYQRKNERQKVLAWVWSSNPSLPMYVRHGAAKELE